MHTWYHICIYIYTHTHMWNHWNHQQSLYVCIYYIYIYLNYRCHEMTSSHILKDCNHVHRGHFFLVTWATSHHANQWGWKLVNLVVLVKSFCFRGLRLNQLDFESPAKQYGKQVKHGAMGVVRCLIPQNRSAFVEVAFRLLCKPLPSLKVI